MSETGWTILIIAGTPEDRAMFRRYLSQAGDESYEFLETAGGTEGVAACIAHWPDGIVLADPLPDMTGLEFLVTLKQYNETMAWPVVLVSDTDSAAAAVQAIKGGAQDYLVKDKTLPERLQQVLQNIRQRPIEAQRPNLLARNRAFEIQVVALQQEMEARYRGLFTSMQEGFLLAEMIEDEADQNVNFRYLDVNPAAERMLGLKREQIVGQTARALIPELSEELLQLYANVVRTGEPLHHEVFEPMLNQHHENFAFRPAPGQIAVLFGDITDRKQTEEALRRTTEQLQIVTDSMAVPVTRCSRDLKYVWVSQPYADWIGRSVPEITGRPIIDIIGPEAFEQLHPYFEQVLAGQVVRYEEQVPFRGIGPRWITAIYTPTLDAQGVCDGWVAVVIDIDPRKRMEEILQESEERFRLLVQHSAHIIWRTAPDGNFIGRQESWERFTGQNFEDYQNLGGFDPVHPEDRGTVSQQWQRAIAAPTPFQSEYRLRNRYGEYRYVLSRGIPLLGPEGRVKEWVGYIEDITERKQAEEALRRGQQRLQMVLRAGRMGWWERDLRTNETVWSDSLYDLLGLGSHASRPSYELFMQRVHPDDRSKVQERVRKAMDDGGEYSAEYRLLHPNGGTRWVLEKGRIFYDQADQAQRMVGVSLDITQRKWVEEGLRESEAILRSFYENTSLLLGLVELDEDDIVHLYDNPATHRFYGLQAHESMTGQRASQLGLSPAAIHEWCSHYQASATSGQPVQFEYKHDGADGPRWLAVTVAIIGPGFSGRTRFCYVAEDITERKVFFTQPH